MTLRSCDLQEKNGWGKKAVTSQKFQNTPVICRIGVTVLSHTKFTASDDLSNPECDGKTRTNKIFKFLKIVKNKNP